MERDRIFLVKYRMIAKKKKCRESSIVKSKISPEILIGSCNMTQAFF